MAHIEVEQAFEEYIEVEAWVRVRVREQEQVQVCTIERIKKNNV